MTPAFFQPQKSGIGAFAAKNEKSIGFFFFFYGQPLGLRKVYM
jgi:hypothetical protein